MVCVLVLVLVLVSPTMALWRVAQRLTSQRPDALDSCRCLSRDSES